MAERVVRQLIDDIDGAEIPEDGGERVEFCVRGVGYQIDLSTTNVAKFDKALKPYVAAATKLGNPRAKRAKSSRNGTGLNQKLGAIREWARENGYEVSERGRIKGEVVEAFEAAQ